MISAPQGQSAEAVFIYCMTPYLTESSKSGCNGKWASKVVERRGQSYTHAWLAYSRSPAILFAGGILNDRKETVALNFWSITSFS